MRIFVIAAALVSSCLAVPQTYEIPSGKVSFSSNVPYDGAYGQYYGAHPSFRYGQNQAGYNTAYGVVQPTVKSVVAHPVHDFKPFGAQTFQGVKPYGVQSAQEKFFVQPALRYNVPSHVIKPSVPYVQSVSPVANKYVAEARISQPVTPFVQHVSPVTYPKVSSYPVFQHTPYVHSYEKAVKPVVPAPFVPPFVKYDSPVARVGQVAVPSMKYAQNVAPVVQPFARYGQVAPVYGQQGFVAKTAEAPAAILTQNQDSNVDGNFVANFQTENGIQSSVSGTVKPVFGSDEPAQVMSGSYSYTSPDGTPVVTHWYADENGFHADGDHIPAVPEEIQRSLEYVNSAPVAPEEFKYVRHY